MRPIDAYVKTESLRTLASHFRPKKREPQFYEGSEPTGFKASKGHNKGKARKSTVGLYKRRYSL